MNLIDDTPVPSADAVEVVFTLELLRADRTGVSGERVDRIGYALLHRSVETAEIFEGAGSDFEAVSHWLKPERLLRLGPRNVFPGAAQSSTCRVGVGAVLDRL